jgi:MFS transporter, ACS family, hexuronate transporter
MKNGPSRWIPAVSMLLVSLISYIDRNTLALLAPTILRETHLSNQQYGYIITAFSIAYTIGNPLWGRALDRLGLRVGMLLAVSLWTAASVSHVFAAGFLGFFLARAALGFGEGATFPAGLRTVVQTLPPDQRARGIAVSYSGGSLGAIITPLIVTPIALWWGWRSGFWFTGFVGLLWILVWLWVSRRPELRAAAPKHVETPAGRMSFRDRRVWSFMAAYAFGALPLGFILYETSIYLSQSWGQTQAGIGKVLWIPPLGWEAGYFFWGWVSDRRLRADPNPVTGLRGLFTAAVVLSLPLALTPRLPAYWMVLVALFFSMFIASAFLILPVVYATRIYSSGYSGLIAGLGAGAWSAAVAVLMPIFGRLFDHHQIQAAFTTAALFPVAGYAIWMWANRGEGAGRALSPVNPEMDEQAG